MAILEVAKAVHNRVKKMTGLNGGGANLKGTEVKDDQPTLVFADVTVQTGRDIQFGHRFLHGFAAGDPQPGRTRTGRRPG